MSRAVTPLTDVSSGKVASRDPEKTGKKSRGAPLTEDATDRLTQGVVLPRTRPDAFAEPQAVDRARRFRRPRALVDSYLQNATRGIPKEMHGAQTAGLGV